MNADAIRNLKLSGDATTRGEDAISSMLQEIAAQLAELNETLKAANQLQKDLFGFELNPKNEEHGKAGLDKFLTGLKQMGPDGETRS